MSMVFECQKCLKNYSALTSEGLCVGCATEALEAIARVKRIKLALIQSDGNVAAVSKLIGEPVEKIEEIKSTMKYKKFDSSMYQCTRCGKPTEVLFARAGRTGICEICDRFLEKKSQEPDRHKVPEISFSESHTTSLRDESGAAVEPRRKKRKE